MNITWDVTEPVKKHYSLKKEWDYNKPFSSCGLVMLCMNLIKWFSHYGYIVAIEMNLTIHFP
jgi:hypothetical protein